MCVFWDADLLEMRSGGWSSEGCTQLNNTDRFVYCRCNRLAAFTVFVVSEKYRMLMIYKTC